MFNGLCEFVANIHLYPRRKVFNKNEFTGMMKWSRRSNPNHVHSFTTAGASDRERSPSPLPLELDPCHTDIDVSGKIPEEANPNAALPHQRVVLQRLNVIRRWRGGI